MPPAQEVSLGQRVMVLAKKNEDPQKVAAGLGVGGQAKAAAAGKATADKAASSASAERAEAAAPVAAAAATGVATNGGPADRASGNGQPTAENGNGRSGAEETNGPATGRIKASPLARKLAAASSIDLARVRGSGPGGRIVRRDVEDYLKTRPSSAAATAKAPAPQPRPAADPLAAQRIPHSRMRKTIAQRMLQAKQAAPEIHLTVDIRADRLVAAREELNKRLVREGIKLSLGDFVTKAVAMALRAHPGVNASFEPDAIVRHGEVNIGIAVALPEGLIVPVLHRADTLGLREIRKQSEALAAAARSSTLSGEQLTGSTFTISNLGMYGIRQFDAILNMPEVGILAVGTAEKRPVVEGDKLVVGTVMTVTLTADHRAVNGAMAAEFLQTLKGLLEEPTAMLL